MDISDDSDSSLSPLLYPQNDEKQEPLLLKATKISTDPVDTREPAKQIPSPPYGLLSTGTAPHVPMAVLFGRCISYCGWKEHMGLLREKLKEEETWQSETMKETFRRMGMAPWYDELSHQMKKEETMDWTAWKDFVIEEWTTLFPEELSMVFR